MARLNLVIKPLVLEDQFWSISYLLESRLDCRLLILKNQFRPISEVLIRKFEIWRQVLFPIAPLPL